ncbi:MAG: hypothetical protein EOP48_14110 [Sphingobacteriales bacterium]|nr:MAG: hypothetical protein EOP48_14110 [Sphingobacteriales bacterium]
MRRSPKNNPLNNTDPSGKFVILAAPLVYEALVLGAAGYAAVLSYPALQDLQSRYVNPAINKALDFVQDQLGPNKSLVPRTDSVLQGRKTSETNGNCPVAQLSKRRVRYYFNRAIFEAAATIDRKSSKEAGKL